jgi:N-acetylneuraminate synthase
MVDRTRELEYALGSPKKRVAENEKDTVVVQRRCLRAARDLQAGVVLTADMVEALRPAPAEAVKPYELNKVVGKKLRQNLSFGEILRWADLDEG